MSKEEETAQVAQLELRIQRLQTALHDQLIKSQAQSLAESISTVPALMSPLIAKRMRVDFSDDDTPAVVFLDDEGEALENGSIETLRESFVTNKDFSSIIRATNASGGGANTKSTSSGGAATKPEDMSERERLELKRENPEQFRQTFNTLF